MNVTELARRLRIHPRELLRILPEYGFDIGMKAVKVDNKVASQIMKMWPKIKRDMERKRQQEQEERRKKELEMRRESGETVVLPRVLMVREFSERLNLPVNKVITELMRNGILANQNQDIDFDTAAIIAEELGFNVQKEEHNGNDVEKETQQSNAIEEARSQSKELKPRSPVIVVMGHVDHGKTKLLDTIRETNIVDKEAGGITQHIGAYQTVWKDPKTKAERALTFIDTPGHEAFTVMRSRGAKVADIAILVVAADDGVKPQTDEVIQILKAAKLPFVVAMNKMDKETADIQKTMTELSQRNIIPEEWGGDVPMVPISAKAKMNIDKLLDVLLLVADMREEEIQADPNMPAVGTIIESHVDKGTGPIATVLIQSGTLKQGDSLVVNGEIYGKVRAMRNYRGDTMSSAGPSVPAQIIGFKVAPEVGDVLDLRNAVNATVLDVRQKRAQQTGAVQYRVVETGSDEEDDGKKKMLNLVIKADVLGSLEAIVGSLDKLRSEDIGIKIIGKGLGNITEDDVSKAEAGGGKLVGFNVKPTPNAEETIREKKMDFVRFDIIYNLIDWVKAEMEKLLEYDIIVTEHGTMEVRGVFRTEKNWMIVGGLVKSGKVIKDAKVRVIRDGQEEGIGTITNCQIGQQEEKSIPSGTEGGIRFEGKVKIEKGDILEVYTEEKKIRKLTFEQA